MRPQTNTFKNKSFYKTMWRPMAIVQSSSAGAEKITFHKACPPPKRPILGLLIEQKHELAPEHLAL